MMQQGVLYCFLSDSRDIGEASEDAVAICRKGIKLGYVPRSCNALPAQLLRFGHDDVIECRIPKVDATAEPWKQISVGLYLTGKPVVDRSAA